MTESFWTVDNEFPHVITMAHSNSKNSKNVFADIMDAFSYRHNISRAYKNAFLERTEYTRFVKEVIDRVKV